MGTVTIDGLMEGFSSLLHHANPNALPQFMEWVDKKVSAYRMMQLSANDYESCASQGYDRTVSLDSRRTTDNNIKHLISDTVNQNTQTSQAPKNVNLSPMPNGPLATLIATNKASPTSKLTLKVPCISPKQPCSNYGYFNSSPSSVTSSPQAGITPRKQEEYSALRNLLQSSARINLSHEFDEKPGSDMDSCGEELHHKMQHNCQLCGKMFLHRSSFRRHMKLHQGVFTHKCDQCQRKFTRREHYLRHKCSSKLQSRDQTDLDSSFDSVTDSPVRPEMGWPENRYEFSGGIPLDMSSKVSDNGSIDGVETSSVSSGQISPPQGSECSRRNGRKSAAPRKLESKSFPENDDYMSDVEESMYESISPPPQDEGNLVIDMSIKKPIVETAEKEIPKRKKPTAEVQPLPQSREYMPYFEPRLAQFAHEAAASAVSSLQMGRGYGIPAMSGMSPPPGFRIGDLIESAVTKYHGAALESSKIKLPHGKSGSALSSQETYPSSPKMKAKMYSKIHSANEALVNQVNPLPQPDEDPSMKGNFLATETGTYQITTEALEGENASEEDKMSAGKVIKVVKQGNYLKLKKEAQVIDGELRFICPHCNKVFHRSSNFSRHMRIHRGVYSYICSTCNRGFYRKEHFDKHKCYRKSMATTWERKTKVDLDQEAPEKCDKENDFRENNMAVLAGENEEFGPVGGDKIEASEAMYPAAMAVGSHME